MISVDEPFLPINKQFGKHYRLKEVLELLGHPESQLPTINVVGTNGKGSTSFYLSQGLLNEYSKVGLFISPAFLYQNERIQINNQLISDDDLKKYLNQVKPYIKPYELTFFEVWTLMAVLYFKDQQVEIVVMEAGIGGILDATNLMSNQVATLLTAVAFDHTDVLGNSLEKILQNKIGIAKPNSKLFISVDNQPLKPLIDQVLEQLDLNLEVVWTTLFVDQIHYQQGNKGLVRDFLKTLKITDESYLNLTPPLGRFTVLQEKPLIIIDGAHNQNGIENLITSFKELYPDKKPTVLVGFSSQKDFPTNLKLLEKAFPKQIILTEFDHQKSWMIKEETNFSVTRNWKQFLLREIELQNDIIITGSLYFVPQVYAWFTNLTF